VLSTGCDPIRLETDRVTTDLAATPTPSTTTDGGPALRFDGLSMVFPDGTRALEDITFAVSPGEFVTVVGPSGCGKSTLLRIASGLEQNTGGVWRTVQRNVELLAELHGMSRAERAARAREAIELVGLGGHEKQYPKQLSGGMRMRCSLARSLVMEPRVFLFDEPFGALDEITRERLNDELLRLFRAIGFAGLFITHSIAEAVFLSTRVVVMSARPGGILADVDVPFAYPREPDLRYDPSFAELSGQVSDALKDAHA
jgi:NitT/TauT family transport system ATP-binding protein